MVKENYKCLTRLDECIKLPCRKMIIGKSNMCSNFIHFFSIIIP